MTLSLAGMIGTAVADTHLYVGAVGTNRNDALAFTGAKAFDIASGFRFPMVLRTTGLNAGFFRGDVLTFTALPAAEIGTGQLPGRALFGSRLAVEVAAVLGPAGGEFAFWEGDGELPGAQVTFSVPCGVTHATNHLVISENDGAPGSDPYGHIHGRAFTTTKPGLYTVGFRAIDISTHGVDGGPLHSPSEMLWMYFQAGPAVESIVRTGVVTRVSFRSAPGVSNVLEAANQPEGPDWTRVAGPLRGNVTLQSLAETNDVANTRYYRLRLLNTPP